jgi:hypothetical protein
LSTSLRLLLSPFLPNNKEKEKEISTKQKGKFPEYSTQHQKSPNNRFAQPSTSSFTHARSN